MSKPRSSQGSCLQKCRPLDAAAVRMLTISVIVFVIVFVFVIVIVIVFVFVMQQ